jgi:DNA repair exonuclease SbcCD ATPase subunit
MPTQRLQELLSKLQEEVDQLGDSSQKERERLESLISEIQTTLDQDDADQQASLLDSLRNKLGEFESAHPTASGIVRRLMQALGDMGI